MVSCVQALLSSKMHYTMAAALQPAVTSHKNVCVRARVGEENSAACQRVRMLVSFVKGRQMQQEKSMSVENASDIPNISRAALVLYMICRG
jgi:hypothetical protein